MILTEASAWPPSIKRLPDADHAKIVSDATRYEDFQANRLPHETASNPFV